MRSTFAMLLLFLAYLQLSIDGATANFGSKSKENHVIYRKGRSSMRENLNTFNDMTSGSQNHNNRRYLSQNWKETLSGSFGDNKKSINKSNGLVNAPVDGLKMFKKSVNQLKQFTDSNNIKAKQDWKKYGHQD